MSSSGATENMKSKIHTSVSKEEASDQYHDSNKPPDDIKNKKHKAPSNWSKFWRPWTWKRKKKSEKFVSVATTLERKISVRSTKEDLIRRGVLTDPNGTTPYSQKETQRGVEKKSRHGSNNESPPDKAGGDGEENLPSTNIDQHQSSSTNTTHSDVIKRPKNAEHNSSLKRSTPVYIHQKYPSDEVSRMPRDVLRQTRLNPNRHSYQMATSSSLSNQSPDSQQRNKPPNHMHPEPQQPHPKHSIGLQAVPQSISKSAYSVVSQPPSAARKARANPTTTVGPNERYHNTARPPGYDKKLFDHNRSRSASVQFVTDPQHQAAPTPAARASWDFSTETHLYNSEFSSTSNDEAMQNLHISSNSDHPSRPHAAKRTQYQHPFPEQQPQPPPPPPQASKPTSTHHQSRPSQQTPAGGGIIFAGSAEIIQRATHINIPPYILEKFHGGSAGAKQVAADENSNGGHAIGRVADGGCDSDSDSDSLGPVLYRDDNDDEEDSVNHHTMHHHDDDDDDDDDVAPVQGLAAKVARRDTLAMRLGNQSSSDTTLSPAAKELAGAQKSEAEKSAIRTNLTRRLSQRPTKSELEQRNILPQETPEDRHKEREKVKRQLSRKLSVRPTVKELVERNVLINFHEYVEVYEVQNYDRRGDKPWTRLTPADKASIRKELNEFKKNEMEVHEESRHYTRYHKP